MKKVGSAHFFNLPVTLVSTLKRIFKVLRGDGIVYDVRLSQKSTSVIVEHLLMTLYDSVKSKTFVCDLLLLPLVEVMIFL